MKKISNKIKRKIRNRQSMGILLQLRIPAIQGTHKNEDGMRETHKNKLPQSQFV